MLDFLYRISDLSVFLIIAAFIIVFSLLLIILNKIFIFYKFNYKDNTPTASIASLIGIIYGVMVGFLCLYLLNNQDHASNAALNEGIAAANIYRESKWLKEPVQHQIQADLKTYLEKVITVEWPAMSEGKSPDRSDGDIINKMSNELMHYSIITQGDAIIVTDLLQEIKSLFKGRQERVQMSQTQLSPDLWLVILIGTILIIVINYAFRVNFYLHIFSITAFAIMATSVVFILVTLDRPFQGEFVVEPTAVRAVLDFMNQNSA